MRLLSESDTVTPDGFMPKECLHHTERGAALLVEFLSSLLFCDIRKKTEHSQLFEVCGKQIINRI